MWVKWLRNPGKFSFHPAATAATTTSLSWSSRRTATGGRRCEFCQNFQNCRFAKGEREGGREGIVQWIDCVALLCVRW